LRGLLVAYAGVLLDREEGVVAVTPAGVAALRAAEEASPAT
jgi:hypothetical protein